MKFGQQAEAAAALFLEGQGYRILERNYTTRAAEVDLIAIHQDTLVFIEVKGRHSVRYGLPAEAVGPSKQKKIISAALHYMRENKIADRRVRFDVITLLFQNGHYQIELIPNAFQGV